MNDPIEQRFKNVSNSKKFSNIVFRHDLRKKRVLDLGCSYGEFLAHFGAGSVGITISGGEAEYGKDRGLNARIGNAENTLPFVGEFDVIFANNLLEHLYAPHEFLCTIKKYLKPEGFLILGVPCIPIIFPLLRLKKFQGSLADAHINFFTKNTLRKTVERAGWDIGDIRGFHFATRFFDKLLDPIYPHFYVTASVQEHFEYP